MKYLLLAVIIALSGMFSGTSAQSFPSGFSRTNVGSNWNQPVGAAFTKDGTKLFVWEKGGKVYLCKWNSNTLVYDKQTTPVLDISAEVGNWRDHGLLGFALDPNFDATGLIYLLYVVDRHHLMNFGTANYNASTNDYFKATIGRVTRYQTISSNNNIVADPATRAVLIGESPSTGIPILYESHGVGSLAFAADGTLLISAGDGASYNRVDAGSLTETYYAQALTDGIIRNSENVGSFRSQLVNSMNGKILRIDPTTGDGIPSNPFYLPQSPREAQSRVWAMGLRNPFRFSIKPNTGSLSPLTGDIGEIYVGDVGWDRYEELNVIEKAATNCGWPIFEGNTYMSGYAGLNTANRDEPNSLFGINGCTAQYYTFRELIKQATADQSTAIFSPCDPTKQITSANNNRFYHRRPAIDWRHAVDSTRIGYFSGNNAAVAQLGSPASQATGVPFRGNCSVAGCWYTGTMFPAAYRNTFFQADYGASWLKSMDVQFTDVVKGVQNFATGFIAIVGVVENPLDGSLVYVDVGANRIGKVKYSGNQPPIAEATADKLYGPGPLVVNVKGSSSSDPEGGPLTYNWNFGDGTFSTDADPQPHTFTATGPKKFVVKLTVTDNQNDTAIDSIIISVNNTPPFVRISSPIRNSLYRLGADTSYTLSANVTDAEQGPGQLKYEWQTFLRHNTHQHAEAIDTNRNTTAMISRIGCNGDNYYWFFKLTVTDDAGLSSSDSTMIFPNCVMNSTLPLLLRSFSVAAKSDGNLVKWTTESETDLADFVLERSPDGHQFTPVNQQDARGGDGITQYSYLDNNFPSGDSYYRLKMVDKTTGYYFSMVIRVFTKLDQQGQLIVVPNPVENDFALGGYFDSNGQVQIQISDANGRILQSYRETVSSGFNNMQVNVPNHLPAGIYFIEVIENNKARKTKFIKVP